MSDQPPSYSADADAAAEALSVRVDLARRRITVRGELDLATTPTFADATNSVLAHKARDCTIDIAGVPFIDARGLGCLVHVANELASNGAKLRLIGATPRLRRVFDIAGLGGLLFPPLAARAAPWRCPNGT